MERRRTPVRRAAVAAALLLVVIGLAGCGGTSAVGTGPAATVGGVHISRAKVIALLKAQIRQLQSEAKSSDATTASDAKSGLKELVGPTGLYSTKGAAFVLTQLVVVQAFDNELARHGIKITAADRKAARSSVESQSGGAAALAKADAGLVDFTVDLTAAKTAIEKLVAKDVSARNAKAAELQDLYQQSRASTPLCVSLVFNVKQAASTAARASIDRGQSFASVAKAKSEDPTTAKVGGYAGCASVTDANSSFPANFTGAHVGQLYGPLHITGRGWVVVKVVSTTGPTFAQAKPDLEAELKKEGASATEAANREQTILRDAKVTVDPRYGRWDPSSAAVLPPADADTTTSTTVAGNP